MNKNDIYKHVDDCLVEDMDGELLVFNPNNATTIHLNGPSSVIWQLCTGQNSAQEMIDALQEAYPEQADQIEHDVVSTLQDLKDREVLELVET